ncbi:MAG: hypothetical protein G01um101438_540 [Parcubacteria group bacterium Gr01-1014_38]|nr:MAG: hypothetical protein G01um101438_540 [Parcubacteria group bacterium Gr01-1014_38]
MMIASVLDRLFLGIMVVVPWVLLACALAPFRERIRREWPFFLLIGALTWGLMLILFSPLTETFQQAVIHITTKPWFELYRVSILRAHHAPLWLSNLSLGLPALAHPYTAYFSPLTSVLLLFRDMDIGVNILLLVHLSFAAATLALVLRELGIARVAVLIGCVALVWNPWVFRRLSPEVHAIYVFGFAWIPLAWGLLLRFLRTMRFTDALAAGIPLAFMAISMPTVFAQMTLVVVWFLVAACAGALLRRQWNMVGRICAGGALIVASVFLTAAPEHLAASEFFAQQSGGSRFGLGRIYGWRDRDLTAREFLRTLLPNDLGRMFVSRQGPVAHFGVPFSPGDAVVVLALLGAVIALKRRTLRHAVRPGAHLVLVVFLANVATHGIAYGPLHRLHPLWAPSGNWPVLGVLMLFSCALFSAIGTAWVIRMAHQARRFVASRLPSPPTTVSRMPALLTTATICMLLGAEMLWGVTGIIRGIRSDDPNVQPTLRFSIPTQTFENMRRLPHIAYLASRMRDYGDVGRVFCIGDHGRWPSPCFDDAIAHAGLEVVGVPELAWGMPGSVAVPFARVWSEWSGTFSVFARTLLELAHATHVVTTRRLDLPLEKEILWEPMPGNSEISGNFLAHAVNGGAWKEEWDRIVRIHTLPSAAPYAFFADPVLLDGSEADAERVVTELLGGSIPAFHPRKIALVYPSAKTSRIANFAFPPIPAGPEGVSARNAFFTAYPRREGPVERSKIVAQSTHPGAWNIAGTAPRDGVIVLSQLFYPGFRAWINNNSAPVLRADLMFSAIPVSKGPFSLRVQYAPLHLLLAGVLPLAFAVVFGVRLWREAFASGSRQ